jgi:hypothetical protein
VLLQFFVQIQIFFVNETSRRARSGRTDSAAGGPRQDPGHLLLFADISYRYLGEAIRDALKPFVGVLDM